MIKTLFLVFLYVAFSAVGNIMVSCGMRQKAVYIPHVLLGTLILTLGYGIYLGLLKEVPLSVVVPANVIGAPALICTVALFSVVAWVNVRPCDGVIWAELVIVSAAVVLA